MNVDISDSIYDFIDSNSIIDNLCNHGLQITVAFKIGVQLTTPRNRI